jgi:hypothetical protein
VDNISDSDAKEFLFKPAQFLGTPRVFPPLISGKITASVQFIIPSLSIGKKDKNSVFKLARACNIDVWGADSQLVTNQRTGDKSTRFTFTYYVNNENKQKNNEVIMSTGRLLAERFLGLLSFFFGIKLSAVNLNFTTLGEKSAYTAILPAMARTSQPPIKIEFPENIDFIPPEEVFSALFWLRRGLAERDPIENYSALMVCLQIIANHLIPEKNITKSCPSCGVELSTQPLSITQKVSELLTTKLSAPKDLSDRLWKVRNAIVAHGNKPVNAEVFLELTELKFEAVTLAYKGVKLALGIPFDSPPNPDPSYFITDALMYVD